MTTKLHFIYRRHLEYGLLQDPSSEMTDQDLISFVQEVKQTNPHCGIQMMCGKLRSRGYVVTRERVRNALRSLDPLNAVSSWLLGGVHTQLLGQILFGTLVRSHHKVNALWILMKRSVEKGSVTV